MIRLFVCVYLILTCCNFKYHWFISIPCIYCGLCFICFMCILPLKDSLTYIDLIDSLSHFLPLYYWNDMFRLPLLFILLNDVSLPPFVLIKDYSWFTFHSYITKMLCFVNFMGINKHHCLICTSRIYSQVCFILHLSINCNGVFHLCTLILFNSMFNSLM